MAAGKRPISAREWDLRQRQQGRTYYIVGGCVYSALKDAIEGRAAWSETTKGYNQNDGTHFSAYSTDVKS